jgi:vacuolar-type H+-ATPase subunit F/Vma7
LNVAAIGDPTFTSGFELIGVKGFIADDEEQAKHVLRDIIDSENYAVIIIPERFLDASKETRSQIMKEGKIVPLFAFLPDYTGIKGKRVEELKKSISLAVGTELKL